MPRAGSRAAGREVGVGVLGREALDRATGADLAVELAPVDDERCVWHRPELGALRRLIAREEAKAPRPEALEQDHARVGVAREVHGRQRHRLGQRRLVQGLLEPDLELLERVAAEIRARERRQVGAARAHSPPSRHAALPLHAVELLQDPDRLRAKLGVLAGKSSSVSLPWARSISASRISRYLASLRASSSARTGSSVSSAPASPSARAQGRAHEPGESEQDQDRERVLHGRARLGQRVRQPAAAGAPAPGGRRRRRRGRALPARGAR